MFAPTADCGHVMMRFAKLAGNIPKKV